MTTLDLSIIAASFAGVLAIGWALARRQTSAAEYFLGSRSVGWPLALCSLVATETSGITFIGVPAMAFGGSWVYLQMALGYAVGRVLVAWLLVPEIRKGNFTSVYEYLHARLGRREAALAAVVFLATRLVADGARVYVTAIPLTLVTGWPLGWSFGAILVVTAIYSLLAGVRGVVWTDTVQLVLYLAGGIASIVLIAQAIPEDLGTALARAAEAGRLRVFDLSLRLDSFTLWAGLIGGAAFSFASHGTDHLMAQRYLLTPTDRDAKIVVIGSGLVSFAQCALFLFLGSCLYCLWPGREFPKPNDVFPAFMATMPSGLRGLVLSAVFAAAMSTLSGTINALAASTVRDLGVGLFGLDRKRAESVGLARFVSFWWVLALGGAAFLASLSDEYVIDLALGVAAVTYGGVLGIFLIGRFTRLAGAPVLAGFLAGTSCSACLYIWPVPGLGAVKWPWFVPVGATIVLIVAGLAAAARRTERAVP
jgi:Na+/proline symporter